MWKRDEGVRPPQGGRQDSPPATPPVSGPAAHPPVGLASQRTRAAGPANEGRREHRKICRHQGRAEWQRGPDHRRSGRRQDRAAAERAHHRAERQDQGTGVRQVGHRARAKSWATSPPRRRSTFATTDRSTAISSSPRVAIAEGAHFRGSIDMQRQGAAGAPAKASRPTPSPRQRRGRSPPRSPQA